MVLTIETRGALERIIEQFVSGIPENIKLWRNENVRKEYKIRDVDEFVYGHTVGSITTAFASMIFAVEHRTPTLQEMEEAKTVIFERIPKIREAMHKAG
ncbi:MAG: hypothetical protein DA330_00585 [Nitrososphaera sp.]|nr:hypothetical protein [Nitrososphaera sp.]